jgi:hypothetical protein
MLAQLGPIRIAITPKLQEKRAVRAPMRHVKLFAFPLNRFARGMGRSLVPANSFLHFVSIHIARTR